MLFKQYFKQWTHQFVGIALITGCGLTVAHASCTLTLCREKGHGYDCHQVDDSPEWICRQAKSAAQPAPTPAPSHESVSTHTPEHSQSQSPAATSTTPSVPIQAPVLGVEPDLIPDLAPDLEPVLEPVQPVATTVVPPQQ